MTTKQYMMLGTIVALIFITIGFCIYDFYLEQKEAKKMRLPVASMEEKRKKMNEILEPIGFAYDVRQDVFYSLMYSWQRNYGYCCLFDEAAIAVNVILDCEPIYFEYQNKKWMIEFWKGQYGANTGGEIGVYYCDTMAENSQHTEEVFYKSVADEERLDLKFILWDKKELLCYRSGSHWWLSGFLPGVFSNPKHLKMDIEINLLDREMKDAFILGCKNAGYSSKEISILGNTIWLTFDRPHKKQPQANTKYLIWTKQRENKKTCKLFSKLTKEIDNPWDKLEIVKNENPLLYGKILTIGKPQELFVCNGTKH